MVLYCSLIPTNLVYVLTHRLVYRKDNEAVLLVNSGAYKSRGFDPILDSFVENNIFNEIYRTDFTLKNRHFSPEYLEQDIIALFSEKLCELEIDLSKYEEIISANDDWDVDVNVALNMLGIKYSWLQNTSNAFLLNRKSYQYSDIVNKLIDDSYSMGPLAKFAEPILRNDDIEYSIALEKIHKEYSSWDFLDGLRLIPDESFIKLLNCYQYSMDVDYSSSTLLLMNSDGYGRAGKNSNLSDEMEFIVGYNSLKNDELSSAWYNKAIDYFDSNSSDRLFVKYHPNDPLSETRINELYGDSALEFPNVPMEFVAEFLRRKNKKINHVLGVSTTSNQSLDKKSYVSSTFLGGDYFECWFYYDSIFVVFELLRVSKYKKVYCNEKLKNQLINLCRHYNASLNIDSKMNYEGKNDECYVVNSLCDPYPTKNILDNNLVIVLNIPFSEKLINLSHFNNLRCLEIHKESTDYRNKNLYPEYIYFSGDSDGLLKDYRIIKTNSHSHYKFETRLLSYYDICNIFSIKYKGLTIENLQRKLIDCNKRIDNILLKCCNYIAKGNYSDLFDFLKTEKDFCVYLKLLSILMPYVNILISVKDTPGDMMPNEILTEIHRMGFEKLTKGLWVMYAAVSNGGTVLVDQCGQRPEENVHVDTFIESDKVVINSQAWRNGNKAEIIVNNIDYSLNKRGLNIVVLDKKSNCLIDSVAYDSHREIVFVHN